MSDETSAVSENGGQRDAASAAHADDAASVERAGGRAREAMPRSMARVGAALSLLWWSEPDGSDD